ncbi:MAG TPA: S8 family peptidase [Pyrinomonadaceae bacterium]|nr:S8 family peptidase [Pyrinomonadaceae bacterium]
MKKIFTLIALVVLCVAALTPAPTSGQKPDLAGNQKSKGKFQRKDKDAIPGEYIVVFKDQATGDFSVAQELADLMVAIYGGKIKHVYKHAINGFAVKMPEEMALLLSEDPRVEYVEEDGIIHTGATQTGATWGLDRIDQRDRPLNGTYNYNFTGSGVRVYVIDTGIRTTHTQFGGRAAVSYDALGGNGQDCNGHGTHVAGTIGGSTYGVAKSASLRAVRVLNCSGSGSTSGVIAGVNWVTQNHIKPAAANMSLGGGASSALDTAVQNSINAGVTYAVAAGNSSTDACTQSPARVGGAITVGSSTSTDARSSFSNYGTCVDIFAPGSSITSAWSTSDTATNTISGTSMASPHVAGVAALYLQRFPTASPATVRNAIVNASTTNRLTGIGTGSPNRLLYSLLP